MLRSRAKILRHELVTNGGNGFTSTSGYNPPAGDTLSVVGGELVWTVAALQNGPTCWYIVSNVVQDAYYRIEFTGRLGTSPHPLTLNVWDGISPTDLSTISTTTSNGTRSFLALATKNSISILIGVNSASTTAGTMIINSFSVKRAYPTFR
jgi:hypothetical protein